MKKVSIITSATYNIYDAKGAFGCIVITENKKFKLEGCYSNSSVNRLELMAVIRALQEVALLYPGIEVLIELCSKQTYLTLAFSPGKLKQNLSRGTSLPNYDLWSKIFELGRLYQWKTIPIKTMALEDFHKKAAHVASETARLVEPREDTGAKKKVKVTSVLDVPEVQEPIVVNEQPSEQNKIESQEMRNDHPIIENNDPPF